MLEITILGPESYDSDKEEFVREEYMTLSLEHSLVAISKWESKWEKPFLGEEPKTDEQTIDYIKAMTLTPNVPDEMYDHLSSDDYKKISSYIGAKMTATWFAEDKSQTKTKKEVVTSEIIYYWMIQMTIPFEFENWHLNRLLTLIQVCNRKNQPDKKMSKADRMAKNRALNEARKAKYNTSG